MNIDTYKGVLRQEEARLELELTDLGYLNPDNPADWTAGANASEMNTADLNNLADADEEQEANKAIVQELEVRLKNIKDALARIEAGTYGVCTQCGEAIEPARLDANPAAETCISCTH
jgi:RNA polymerase-binding transcription factor DksA